MIDIQLIRDNPKKVQQGAAAKGVCIDIEKIVTLDSTLRTLTKNIEDLRAKKNKTGKEIAKADQKTKEGLLVDMRKVDVQEERLRAEAETAQSQLQKLLYEIPNLSADDVKVGKDDRENEVVRTVGEKPTFAFEPKDSLALGEQHDWIDVKRGAKVAGARFGYIKGDLALLEFALLQHAVTTLVTEGFTPVIPPALIKDDMMCGMGFIEHGADQEAYYLEKDKLYLIGTSEQSMGPIHAGETLQEKDLPKRYFAYTPCFRREAGSYGKDTRGMLRVHQFSKVEMLSVTSPDASDREHEFFLSLEEKLMHDLELPYQVVKMCTGDLGTQAARKYDIEAWLPSEQKYRETHSTSTCTDFQTRRLEIRYKPDGEKGTLFAHMVNGTFFSERILLMILENNQKKDGTVYVPTILQPLVGKDVIGEHERKNL